jgi:pantothenate kinase-related protein Tda10
MMLQRKNSLLPIFLQSSCCTGLRNEKHLLQMAAEFDAEMDKQEAEAVRISPDDYYHLLDFKQLINRLPTPVVSIRPPHGQDDYGILFEQLDHIRETMPNVTVYDDYARAI